MAQPRQHGKDPIVVLVTTPRKKGVAERIARALVGERLAACVNIVPQLRSIYRWQGKICNDLERLLLIKTTSARFRALEKRVRELHPYDVPEIIALKISAGEKRYLAWLFDSSTAARKT
ncbi:MAG: divalent-cation tolerance protein CutA [Planctomycetota bacterium]|nr:divalent-cation tolerance protein CutA [Planctomycetota bacterium]